jgi:hypothetical protein
MVFFLLFFVRTVEKLYGAKDDETGIAALKATGIDMPAPCGLCSAKAAGVVFEADKYALAVR